MDHSYFKDRVSAYYDRDLPPYELQALEEHLKECAECRNLSQAAAAGLDEAESIEQGFRFMETWKRKEESGPRTPFDVPVHLIAAIPPPPRPRAFADDGEEETAVPEDRTVLAEEEGLFRLVYFRLGRRAHAGLYTEKPGELSVVFCILDEKELHPVEQDESSFIYDLGPADRLLGLKLEVEFELEGRTWTLSWTFVEQ